MMKIRLLSLIILTTFSLNTVVIDAGNLLSFVKNTGTGIQTNLSPPLMSGDLMGIRHKDKGRIKYAFEVQLKELLDIKREDISRHFESAKAIHKTLSLRERSIFHPADMQFFFRERTVAKNGIRVKCRIKDVNGIRTYYVVFDPVLDADKGFIVKGIYTEEEYEDTGGTQEVLSGEQRAEEEAIERYSVNNEKTIDGFIRERIKEGDFAEIKGRAERLGWDEKYPGRQKPGAYWPEKLTDMIKTGEGCGVETRLDEFLGHFGTSVDKALSGKNLVFIRVPDETGGPVITEKGEEITVESHASGNAVYVFLSAEVFDEFYKETPENDLVGEEFSPEDIIHVTYALVHEVGVIYGLPYGVNEDGKVVNALDAAWEKFWFALEYHEREGFQPFDAYLSALLKIYPELERLKEEPVDLDKSLKIRDYSGGRKKTKSGKREKAEDSPSVLREIVEIFNEMQVSVSPELFRSFKTAVTAASDGSYAAFKKLMLSKKIRDMLMTRSFTKNLTVDSFERLVSNAWHNDGGSMDEGFLPFGEPEQKAFVMISLLDDLCNAVNEPREYSEKVAMNYTTFYRVACANLYNRRRYGKIIRHFQGNAAQVRQVEKEMGADMQYLDEVKRLQAITDEEESRKAREKLKGKVKDLEVMEDMANWKLFLEQKGLLDVYLIACLMDMKSADVKLLPGTRKGILAFFADKVFGEGLGLKTVSDIYGGEQGITALVESIEDSIEGFILWNITTGNDNEAMSMFNKYMIYLGHVGKGTDEKIMRLKEARRRILDVRPGLNGTVALTDSEIKERASRLTEDMKKTASIAARPEESQWLEAMEAIDYLTDLTRKSSMTQATAASARAALLELGSSVKGQIRWFRNVLQQDPSAETEAVARAALLSCGIDTENNIAWHKKTAEEGAAPAAEAVSRAVLLSCEYRVEEQIKWFNGVLQNSPDVITEARCRAALLTHGYKAEDQIKRLKYIIMEGVGVEIEAEVVATAALLKNELLIRSEMSEAAGLAEKAGSEMPTHPAARYTLLVTSEFFAAGELEEHKAAYGDRFELDAVSVKSPKEFVDKVLRKARIAGLEGRNVIALVPAKVPNKQLEKLTNEGIRFIRTNVNTLMQARSEDPDQRRKFQKNTYAMMLLARYIDKDTPKESRAYMLLKFFIKTHFQLKNVPAESYIDAIVNDEITVLVKGFLAYRPAVPYEMPEYDKVAAVLIAA
ncbi:MAG: hypothetical protein ABIA77_02230 [Candidatus Omnitrophota bacterium]